MVSNPPANWPRVIPYLYYEDVAAALDWLAEAFDFAETERMQGPDGKVVHADMHYLGGVVMMGCPGPEFEGPGKTGQRHGGLYIYVDDVDAHFARAKAAGAKVIEEPTDQFYGDRRYQVEDPEGHLWSFATHVRDVPIDEMRRVNEEG